MNKFYELKVYNKWGELIHAGIEYEMKYAVRQTTQIFFDQEVSTDNDIMTATITRIANDKYTISEKVADMCFEAIRLNGGGIRYEILITDQKNINHDYRGNM